MQRRAARIIFDSERTTRTITMFNELNWIPFFIEAYITRCSIVFKRVEGTSPNYVKSWQKKLVNQIFLGIFSICNEITCL